MLPLLHVPSLVFPCAVYCAVWWPTCGWLGFTVSREIGLTVCIWHLARRLDFGVCWKGSQRQASYQGKAVAGRGLAWVCQPQVRRPRWRAWFQGGAGASRSVQKGLLEPSSMLIPPMMPRPHMCPFFLRGPGDPTLLLPCLPANARPQSKLYERAPADDPSPQLAKQPTAHVLCPDGGGGQQCHLSLWKRACYCTNYSVLGFTGN